MKRVVVLLVVSLLLFSLVSARAGITGTAVDDLEDSEDDSNSNTGNQEQNQGDDSDDETDLEDEEENEIEDEECDKWTCSDWGNCLNGIKTRNCVKISNTCTGEQETPRMTKTCEEKERIRVRQRETECPEECTCSGSTIKCMLQSGREMTVTAGKSGNIIVQVKGVDMTTNVTLYKSDDGKVYGVFKNNETKRVKILPDQIKEKIRERTRVKIENENIILSEEGNYNYEAKKDSRFLGFIPIKIEVKAYINPQTGEIIYSKEKWWNFLSKDVEEEPVIGASCGTVTPGQNDLCCQNKGYDVWNDEEAECKFNED